MIQGILIATSSKAANPAYSETAYQFDMLMRGLKPEIAERIRKKKALCLLIGHDELTSQLPQFASNKTGRSWIFTTGVSAASSTSGRGPRFLLRRT